MISQQRFLIILLATFQILFCVLFAFFTDYDSGADPSFFGDPAIVSSNNSPNVTVKPFTNVKDNYPYFHDVHIMIFMGYAVVITFMKRYGYSALGLNLLIGSFTLQMAILISGLLHMMKNGRYSKIDLDLTNMLGGEFACATVLISTGIILGKASPAQLMVMTLIEVPIYLITEFVGQVYCKVMDVGGAMYVHLFGTVFGFGVSRALWKPHFNNYKNLASTYTSDTFSMIGTLFLWLYMPSINSAVVRTDDMHRSIMHTYFALASSVVTSFTFSALVSSDNKFSMVHIQTATLAGGVAVGAVANLKIYPWVAILIGMIGGASSVLGNKFITPLLNKLKFHDSCGVNNVHGIPGFISGLFGIAFAWAATHDAYKNSLFEIFPARAPSGRYSIRLLDGRFTVNSGENRTAAMQAGFQAIVLFGNVLIPLLAGLLTGLLLKLPIIGYFEKDYLHSDEQHWLIPKSGFVDAENTCCVEDNLHCDVEKAAIDVNSISVSDANTKM